MTTSLEIKAGPNRCNRSVLNRADDQNGHAQETFSDIRAFIPATSGLIEISKYGSKLIRDTVHESSAIRRAYSGALIHPNCAV
jgi:hypothetical protein